MEALALSVVIGLAMLLSGVRWGGIARWALVALGISILLTALRQGCEQYPEVCSFSWIDSPTSPSVSPLTPTPSVSPSISVTPITPTTPVSPITPVTPTTPVSPVTPTTPVLPPPSPTPSSPRPTTRPATPSPYLSPCTDGNCTCVDYKCLW